MPNSAPNSSQGILIEKTIGASVEIVVKTITKTRAGKSAKRPGLDNRERNAENASTKGIPGTNINRKALKKSFMECIPGW